MSTDRAPYFYRAGLNTNALHSQEIHLSLSPWKRLAVCSWSAHVQGCVWSVSSSVCVCQRNQFHGRIWLKLHFICWLLRRTVDMDVRVCDSHAHLVLLVIYVSSDKPVKPPSLAGFASWLVFSFPFILVADETDVQQRVWQGHPRPPGSKLESQRQRLPKATALAPHSLQIWTKESCEMGGDSPKKGEAFLLSSKELHTEKRVEQRGGIVF